MQNLYQQINFLDKRCYSEFSLTEDLLMENAAGSIKNYIYDNFDINKKVLIVCGAGNNGADGLALSRMINLDYQVRVLLVSPLGSKMAKLQLKRAELAGVKIINKITNSDIVVDSILGSGFSGVLGDELKNFIQKINKLKAYKIACDIPTGVDQNGGVSTVAFKSNVTITMGAKKMALYGDIAKDYVGKIIVADLGLSRANYEVPSNYKLVTKSDLRLPFRANKNTNKGDFGHLLIVGGEKLGAGVLCARAATKFGAGLVSIMADKNNAHTNPEFMYTEKIPQDINALCIGMGLGVNNKTVVDDVLSTNIPMVIDADLLSSDKIIALLNKKNVVITPHPKEFTRLLAKIDITVSVGELQQNRFYYVKEFNKRYPDVVLVLKGANTIIVHKDNLYINPLGISAMSKGGSGDILVGLIGALICQKYRPIDAAITGSIAHTISSINYQQNNYSLSPIDIINNLATL